MITEAKQGWPWLVLGWEITWKYRCYSFWLPPHSAAASSEAPSKYLQPLVPLQLPTPHCLHGHLWIPHHDMGSWPYSAWLFNLTALATHRGLLAKAPSLCPCPLRPSMLATHSQSLCCLPESPGPGLPAPAHAHAHTTLYLLPTSLRQLSPAKDIPVLHPARLSPEDIFLSAPGP